MAFLFTELEFLKKKKTFRRPKVTPLYIDLAVFEHVNLVIKTCTPIAL